MAIPNNFNPTNNFTYSSILANTVIKKQNKDTVVAGGEALIKAAVAVKIMMLT